VLIDDRSVDHSHNPNGNSNLVIFNSNFQINPPNGGENTAVGMTKKSKKSGLKILPPPELEFRNMRNQNYPPLSDHPPY
jgi:hypothetical protein